MFRPLALPLAAAVLSAACMIALGNLGIYEGAVEMMEQWHLFFDLSLAGILVGALEGAAAGLALAGALAWLYNVFESKLANDIRTTEDQT